MKRLKLLLIIRKLIHRGNFPTEKDLCVLAEIEHLVYRMFVIHAQVHALNRMEQLSDRILVDATKDLMKTMDEFRDVCYLVDTSDEGETGVFMEAMERIQVRGHAEDAFKMELVNNKDTGEEGYQYYG